VLINANCEIIGLININCDDVRVLQLQELQTLLEVDIASLP